MKANTCNKIQVILPQRILVPIRLWKLVWNIAPNRRHFFQLKSIGIFLFLHENMCCVYSLEAPYQGASNENKNKCLHREIRKLAYGYHLLYITLIKPIYLHISISIISDILTPYSGHIKKNMCVYGNLPYQQFFFLSFLKKKTHKNMCYRDKLFLLNIQTSLSKQCRPRSNWTYRSSLIRACMFVIESVLLDILKGSQTDLVKFCEL